MLAPTALRRLRHAAALATLAVAVLGAHPVLGAGEIELSAQALLGGRFPAGGWAAISVTLSNSGAPTSGYIVAQGEDGTVRYFVDLPAGARKQVPLYLRPAAFARQVDVRFVDADGQSLATAAAPVRVLERRGAIVGLVGDGGGNLRPQLLARGEQLPEPIGLLPGDLPERPEPLRGISAIVWAGDSGALNEAQRRTLERWIASGGELIVLGGPDWQARSAGFAELLPVESLQAVDDVDPVSLARWAGGETPAGVGGLTVAVGSLRDGAVGLAPLSADDERPLLATRTLGAGRVVWIGADLATEPFRGWTAAPTLWGRILPDDRIELQFGGMPFEENTTGELANALGQLPALRIPPAELLIGIIVTYILLIGPASYWVLRRLDRRELAWVTAPILVVVFSAGSYGMGTALKGSSVIVNEIEVVRVAMGGQVASVQAYAGIFSPSRATYDLTVDGDVLLAALTGIGLEPGGGVSAGYQIEQGDPAHLRGLAVGVFGVQPVRADAVVSYAPALQVTWRYGEETVSGSVTNAGATTVEDVAIIGVSGGKMIGDLAPGARQEFSVTARDFPGGSAADQLYGFGGFEDFDEEQRTAQVRRSVITALVGYGGFQGRFADFSPGVDRGPFVIGWHADTGPVQVEVDGEEVQRYTQSVEVLSGRPMLGPGPVTLTPSQLPAQVVATEGEVTEQSPGWFALGNGSLTYRVSLPLEASAMQAQEVTVVTGTDPSSVWGDFGGFVSLLPAGYTVEVRDADGAWVYVGDPSARNRFVLPADGRYLDAGGSLTVRVTGTDIPPQQGPTPLFVGAEVAGVVS